MTESWPPKHGVATTSWILFAMKPDLQCPYI
jgi:hypothetical protein